MPITQNTGCLSQNANLIPCETLGTFSAFYNTKKRCSKIKSKSQFNVSNYPVFKVENNNGKISKRSSKKHLFSTSKALSPLNNAGLLELRRGVGWGVSFNGFSLKALTSNRKIPLHCFRLTQDRFTTCFKTCGTNPSQDSSIGSISAWYRGSPRFKSRQGREFFSENK